MADAFQFADSEPSRLPNSLGGHGPERRKRRRALVSAPIRVRGAELNGPDEITATIDVSRGGILFLTCQSGFHRGMEVAVTFPFSKTSDAPQSERPGSVARVSATADGQIAVAIAFAFANELESPTGAPQPHAVADSSSPSVGFVPQEPRKPLILVVDSDQTARANLKTYLSGEGYRVIAVNDATDGREVLKLFTPDLLIAEIEGEELPGFDLCAHVKSTPRLKQIPVMLTTSSASPTDYSSAHSLGAVVCMAKPYRQDRLGHVVRLLVPPLCSESNTPVPQRGLSPGRVVARRSRPR